MKFCLWHKWKNTEDNRYRFCIKCHKAQHLNFYSNRTQEWVNVKEGTSGIESICHSTIGGSN